MAKALVRPTMFVPLVAMPPVNGGLLGEPLPGVANGERAYAETTVVTSLILTKVDEVREEHGPSAATNTMPPLFVPGAKPGFPPSACR